VEEPGGCAPSLPIKYLDKQIQFRRIRPGTGWVYYLEKRKRTDWVCVQTARRPVIVDGEPLWRDCDFYLAWQTDQPKDRKL